MLFSFIIISSLIHSILALDTCRDVITNCNYCGSPNYPRQSYYLQNCMRSCGVCTHLNVALNKPTIQSSIYSDSRVGHNESLARSSNAVDGYTDGNWANGHCTHTLYDRPSWWCVDLRQLYNILYIKLFNRNNNKDRLQGFEIKTSSSGTCNQAGFTSATSCYKDTTPTPQDVYTIERCNQPTSTSLSARTVYVTVSSQVLTLCEVQIFSDLAQCNTGYYSTSSSTCQPCNTCLNDRCDPSNGVCTGDCKTGFYGDYCEDQCGDGCLNSQCDEIDGSCACQDGYYGDTCTSRCSTNCKDGKCSTKSSSTSPECTDGCIDGYKDSYCQSPCPGNCKTCQPDGSSCTACNPGWFGTSCLSSCSSNCVRGCDKVGGRCVECQPDTVGPYCNLTCGTECQPSTDQTTVTCDRNGTCTNCIIGRYGDTCDSECTGCDGGCSRTIGRCINCLIGRYGDRCYKNCSTGCDGGCDQSTGRCTNCLIGRYGVECYKSCSTGCDDGCDRGTGRCTSCIKGKTGDRCNNSCNTDCTVCNQDNANSCTECKDGRWGSPCNELCNSNCKPVVGTTVSKCDQITGNCIDGCVPGKIGSNCTKECVHVSTSAALSPMVYVVIGVVIGVLCGILGTVAVCLSHHFYKKRRQSTPRSPNEEIIPDYMYVPSHLNPSSSTTDETLTTRHQNIPTNARYVDFPNQSFNTEDNTRNVYDTLDHTADDTNNMSTSIDSNKTKYI